MTEEDNLPMPKGEDDPIHEKFINCITRARLAGIDKIENTVYCFAQPETSDFVEINSHKFCSQSVVLQTYVYANFVAFCSKHKVIVLDYLKQANQSKIDMKKAEEKEADIADIGEFLNEEDDKDQESIIKEEDFIDSSFSSITPKKFYSCASRDCDEQITYLGLCDACVAKAESENPDYF
jgi:hypothetical protein